MCVRARFRRRRFMPLLIFLITPTTSPALAWCDRYGTSNFLKNWEVPKIFWAVLLHCLCTGDPSLPRLHLERRTVVFHLKSWAGKTFSDSKSVFYIFMASLMPGCRSEGRSPSNLLYVTDNPENFIQFWGNMMNQSNLLCKVKFIKSIKRSSFRQVFCVFNTPPVYL